MEKRVAKNLPKAFLLSLFVVILSVSLSGCGGTFRSFPSEGDVSGSWNLFLTPSSGSALSPALIVLAQTGENISGTKSDGSIITGSVSGSNISITINNAGGTTTILTGTVSSDWKTMSGTYTGTGSDGSGNWVATKIIPTPTPSPLAVNPSTVTLSCSGTTGVATSQIFQVTGGTLNQYSVTATQNPTLVTLSTPTLTTNGQFTVAANACTSSTVSGSIVNLTVTDTVTSLTVTAQVTILNP